MSLTLPFCVPACLFVSPNPHCMHPSPHPKHSYEGVTRQDEPHGMGVIAFLSYFMYTSLTLLLVPACLPAPNLPKPLPRPPSTQL
jgi:hypothetical protein